jgi:hypothetical protein
MAMEELNDRFPILLRDQVKQGLEVQGRRAEPQKLLALRDTEIIGHGRHSARSAPKGRRRSLRPHNAFFERRRPSLDLNATKTVRSVDASRHEFPTLVIQTDAKSRRRSAHVERTPTQTPHGVAPIAVLTPLNQRSASRRTSGKNMLPQPRSEVNNVSVVLPVMADIGASQMDLAIRLNRPVLDNF